ncbi:MAG: hypothetical protein K5765_09125 [Clostridia bacterium]|nr:hypothetical protein [Clostridia bacterium]
MEKQKITEDMLKYDELNKTDEAIRDEYAKCPEKIAFNKAYEKYKEIFNERIGFSSHISNQINALKSYEEALENYISAINNLGEQVEKCEDTSELELLELKIQDLDKKKNQRFYELKKYENESARLKKYLDSMNEQLKLAGQNYLIKEEEKKNKANEYKKKLLPYTNQILELEKKLPKSFVEKYKKLKGEGTGKKTYNRISTYNKDRGTCECCGNMIRIEVEEILTEIGDLTECPNCGRFLYLKD